MSLFDEFQQEIAKRNPLQNKRTQIEEMRAKAQEAFQTQFLLDAAPEQLAHLKGRIAAFDECLALFNEAEEPPRRQWKDDEE